MCLKIDIFTPRHDNVTNTQWNTSATKTHMTSLNGFQTKTPGITWLNLSKSYRIIDLSDRLIALTYLKNPWNRWTASSTCHNHDNADVQFKQCKNYKINIQFILLQLKILTSVIIHVCNLKFKHMMCYGPSEPEFFKPIFQCWYIGKIYWKKTKTEVVIWIRTKCACLKGCAIFDQSCSESVYCWQNMSCLRGKNSFCVLIAYSA